ncbi:MAG: EAL domain-containing protein [Pseudomonadota bacterium]
MQLALSSAKVAIWDASVPGGKVIDGIIDWSAAGAALLGLPRRARHQQYRSFLDFVHPADRQHVLRTMQQEVDRDGGYELEYRVQRSDGTLRWLAARAKVVGNNGATHTLGIIWDITAHKEEQLAVLRDKDLAQLTLASIGDAVITTDAVGQVQFMNRAAERICGWPGERAGGTMVDTLLPLAPEPDGAAREGIALTCLRLRQGVGSRHSQLLTREGRRVAIEESAAPIWSREGQLLGAVMVFRDVSHERALTQQLSWQASHDALTSLANRREFETNLAAALASAKAEGHHHALLFLNLDRFKLINDTCGHSAGDLLLQLLARMLQTHLRESDVLARLGGDELGALLNACPPERAIGIANAMREAIKQFRFNWENRSFELGVSIGLAPIDQHSKSVSDLLSCADQACHLAKEQGRNRVHVYHEADQALTRRHGEMLWVSRLADAFARDSFRLYAQPIVPLKEGAASHDEVLIRIATKHHLIAPGDFIPAAERYDLMPAIDRWVIEHMCRYLQRHDGASAYSINLSGASLVDAALYDFIVAQFDRYGVAPARICFEITETAMIANLPTAQELMRRLRLLGCRFSLDDFGSGLSSFAYLRTLPVDYLKIDGIFIRDIARNDVNRALVKAINEVGHVMGLQTVAEFVEDEPILDIVRSLGVDFAQGYAVGALRPLTLQ